MILLPRGGRKQQVPERWTHLSAKSAQECGIVTICPCHLSPNSAWVWQGIFKCDCQRGRERGPSVQQPSRPGTVLTEVQRNRTCLRPDQVRLDLKAQLSTPNPRSLVLLHYILHPGITKFPTFPLSKSILAAPLGGKKPASHCCFMSIIPKIRIRTTN